MPPRPDARARRQRRERAETILTAYDKLLDELDLSKYTSFTEVVSHIRAQGAYNLLTVFLTRDPEKLAFDPDAVLCTDLAERLRIADEVIRCRTQPLSALEA